MEQVTLESVLDAIDKFQTSQEELLDLGLKLKKELEEAQEQAEILKENWTTEAGLETSNQIINLLDINPNNTINQIEMCTEGEITYETQYIIKKHNSLGGNDVK